MEKRIYAAITLLLAGLMFGLVRTPAGQRKSSESAPAAASGGRRLASIPPGGAEKIEQNFAKIPVHEWQEIEACYRSNKCDYPQTDSRSYGIAVGRALAEKTASLHRKFRADFAAHEELGRLARRAFLIADGFVQSAALEVFADLPATEENLKALSEGLENNPDPLISEKAMTELRRYLGTPLEAQMQGTVQSMLNGAHFASQKVGENILGFINAQSYDSYKEIQRRLPPQSRVARDLNTALQEYRRQQTGG